jgi:uncharacterized protein (DUF1501 family)
MGGDQVSPNRRALIRLGGVSALAAGAGAVPGARWLSEARAADYRALVCVFLNGGNDGNDTLVPIDAGYDDYARARADLALARDALVPLAGTHDGGRYGLHPGLRPLQPLFDAGRLAMVANAGPLLAPTTIDQARANIGLPPFVGSHADQVAAQQGWLFGEEQSGWGGRAVERLPAVLRGRLPNVTLTPESLLVTGSTTLPRFVRADPFARYFGSSDLTRDTDPATQAFRSLIAPAYADEVEAAYADTLRAALDDARLLARALPGADARVAFPGTELGASLKEIADIMSVRTALGAVRQVFMLNWGTFDTHGHQRGTRFNAQDGQLAELGAALAAFDASMRAQGLSGQVVTFVMSDFGRTLQPAGQSGTDHAWGNHWFAFGDSVRGGRILGRFPQLVLGGADDYDRERRGRWLPGVATDQFAATLVRWLGVPESELATVLPNLVNFPQRTLDLLAT